MSKKQKPIIFTLRTLAKAAGLELTTVTQHRHVGLIVGRKRGGTWVFVPQEVDHYLNHRGEQLPIDPDTLPELYDVHLAAEYCQKHPNTIRKWQREGLLDGTPIDPNSKRFGAGHVWFKWQLDQAMELEPRSRNRDRKFIQKKNGRFVLVGSRDIDGRSPVSYSTVYEARRRLKKLQKIIFSKGRIVIVRYKKISFPAVVVYNTTAVDKSVVIKMWNGDIIHVPKRAVKEARDDVQEHLGNLFPG